MSLPPSTAPTATGWSDSYRAGFAPARVWRLARRTETIGLLQVPEDSVVFVKTIEAAMEAEDEREHLFKKAHFHYLPDTWRAKGSEEFDLVAKGDLLAYLNPVLLENSRKEAGKERRVVDRDDMQQLLLFSP